MGANGNSELSFLVVMALILGPSAFGGLLQGCYRYFRMADSGRASKDKQDGRPSLVELLVVAPGFGIGGGLSAVLASVWLSKFSVEASLVNMLSIIALTTVAGFIGYRLLPAVAYGLEERLNVTEKTATDARQEAEQLSDRLRQNVEEFEREISEARGESMRALTISMAVNALGLKDEPGLKNSADRVTNLVKEQPLDRTVNILLGRLYRWAAPYDPNNLDKAITVLRNFVNEKRKAGEGEDVDAADALYNTSCYLTQKTVIVPGLTDQEKGDLFSEALEALEKAIALFPENKKYADEDPDFKPVREHPRFRKLVAGETR